MDDVGLLILYFVEAARARARRRLAIIMYDNDVTLKNIFKRISAFKVTVRDWLGQDLVRVIV